MNKKPLIFQKKISFRKCIISNEILPKQELIRIVRNKAGAIFIDTSKKQNGRGAYLQPKIELIEQAKKNKSLERALKTKINPEFYESIIKEIIENWD